MSKIKPIYYGLIYLISILIFAVIYHESPDLIRCTESANDCSESVKSLYFSVVTMTTLGFGDITPSTSTGQIITAIQSLWGIVIIGLFLNSLSHEQAKRFAKTEKQVIQEAELVAALKSFRELHLLIEPMLEAYTEKISCLYNKPPTSYAGAVKSYPISEMTNIFDNVSPNDVTNLEVYFKKQGELMGILNNPSVSNMLSKWSKLQSTVIQLQAEISYFEYKDQLLGHINDSRIIEEVFGVLKSVDKNDIYFSSRPHSDQVKPYVHLWMSLALQLQLIDIYFSSIHEIVDEHRSLLMSISDSK